MKYFVMFFLGVMAAVHAMAGTIKGTIKDDKGEPLPFCTVYIQGTAIGTSANGVGEYELQVQPGKYHVVCQFIGYRQSSFEVTVVGDEVVKHDFKLKEEQLQINEVVIRASDEDPAYRIIRNAIKQRKKHLKEVKSFQASIYFKGVMRSRQMPLKFMGQNLNAPDLGLDSAGKGILYLTEEEADYYSDGNKEKTVIHSVHESGDKNGLGFSQFPSVITFYENNVSVLGRASRGFISPVSDYALNYYKYKLEGEFTEHGQTIYKIKVRQKRDYEPCFSGTVYIAEKDWNIHSLDLQLVKESGLDIIDTLRIEQLFLPINTETWVVKNQIISFAVKFMLFNITGTGVAVYNNQRVNEPIPDSVFAGHIVSQYDKGANKKDSSYWDQRPVPLEKDETRDYVVKDSISIIINSPEYQDSVRRSRNRLKVLGLMVGENTFYGKEYKNTYTFNSLFLGLGRENVINFNTVEGLNVAPKFNWQHRLDTGKILEFDAAVRYGFINTHLNSIGRLFYTANDRSWIGRYWMVGAEGGKYVFQYNPQNPVISMLNSYRTLFFRKSDLKIYERWEASAFVKRDYGNGLRWYVRASWQHRLPLDNTTYYSFLPGGKEYMGSNSPAYLVSKATAWEEHNAALVHAYISWRPGYKYTILPDKKMPVSSKWPTFTITYDKGLPGIFNSKTDFDKWRFDITDRINLGLPGSISYHVAVGGFLNTRYVSIPDLMHIYGRRGTWYAAPYLRSFQIGPYYDFSNMERFYVEGHVEYHLNGLLSNKIPLLKQARYYLLTGANAFTTGANNYYIEGFIGIDNIGWKLLRVLRVDFVESWDSYMGRNTGVRLGLNLRAINNGLMNPTESEW